MVAMAGDSYLLKMPSPAPCQAGCHAATARSTSCGVVVAMVLLLAAVLALAGALYYQRLQLCSVQAKVDALDTRLHAVDSKLNRLHEIEQLKAFERASPAEDSDDEEDLSEEDDDSNDELDPYYSDIEDDTIMFERRDEQPAQTVRASPQAAGSTLAKLEAATSSDSDSGLDDTTWVGVESPVGEAGEAPAAPKRVRREVESSPGRRGDPQLRLYHMLQSPGPAAAPLRAAPYAAPDETWSRYGQRQPAMYAERAPMEFVTPPRAYSSITTPSPIASRRSRVMDGAPPATGQQQRVRAGRRQRLQQHQQQQALRDAELAEVQAQWRPRVQLAQQPSWRAARAARVTDTNTNTLLHP